MKRPEVAVLGATGFIGAQVLRTVVESGYRARASFRQESVRWHVEDLQCRWYAVDLDKPSTVREFVRGADAVIHCAGYVPEHAHELLLARSRGVGQMRAVLESCLGEQVKRLVYLSSLTTLFEMERGEARQELDETAFYVPGTVDNAYFEAKAAMEAEIYRFIAGGLNAVILNPSLVMGPGEVQPRTGALIEAVAEGRLPLIPEGITLRVADVRDLAQTVLAALERGRSGRRYFVGGPPVSLRGLIDLIARATEGVVPPRQIEARSLRTLVAVLDRVSAGLPVGAAAALLTPLEIGLIAGGVQGARAEQELGYKPRALEQTVSDGVRWFCRVGYLSYK